MRRILGMLLGLGAMALDGAPATGKKPAGVRATPVPLVAPGTKRPAFSRSDTGIGLAEVPVATSDGAQEAAKRGMALFSKGDFAGAQEAFAKALQLAPENPAILINLGLLAYRQNKLAEAEAKLRQVVRAQPETGLAWLILGVVYYDQEQLDAALAALAQAVLYAPKDARAHHYLGVTVGKKGWYSGAEDEMRRAIELQPDYEEAHYNLAVFYLQRNPPAVELARRHYLKARDLGAKPDEEMERKLKAGE